MTTTVIQGLYDINADSYQGVSANAWSTYTNWSTWLNWTQNSADLIVQVDDDLGTVAVRVPQLNLVVQGTQTITLKVSNTGSFAGEETTIAFTYDGSAVSIPAGRYYRWTVTVSLLNNQTPVIQQIESNYSTVYSTQELIAVDTSTLSGSVAARTVPTTVGTVYSAIITTTRNTAYVDRAYSVPDTFSVSTIAPVAGIVSKSPLQIYLQDHYGVPVDGIVDIIVTGAAKVYHTQDGVKSL
jgi:hypothetical protein